MTNETNNIETNDIAENSAMDESSATPNRRRMLMMGAVAASAVVTIRPAMAQSAASVANCTIRVPGNHAVGKFIAPDGSLVAPETEGAFAAPNRTYSRDEINRAFYGQNLPGSDYGSSRAYVNYMKSLRRGQDGFTCFASIQSR